MNIDNNSSHPLRKMGRSESDRPNFNNNNNNNCNLSRPSLRRRNSTETLYMRNDIRAPSTSQVVYCLSKVLYLVLKNQLQHNINYPINDDTTVVKKTIFCEKIYPLLDDSSSSSSFSSSSSSRCYNIDIYDVLPSEADIQCFLSKIFHKQRLTPQCGIMAAAYIDRLITSTGVTLGPSTWRRILLAALLLADKVIEDSAVWNVDYVRLFPRVTLEDLNRLESAFLASLQFNLALRPSVYARYYFELRSWADGASDGAFMPLDKATAVKLEAKARGKEEELKMKLIKDQRSKSLAPHTDQLNHRSMPLSVEEFRRYFASKNEEFSLM